MKDTQKITVVAAARSILEYYGFDSLSYFALNQKKKFFFSSTGQSFLSYKIYSRVALVSANPIGPENDIQILLTEFKYFLRGAHLTSCFFGIDRSLLDQVTRLGYKKIHIGEEAVLSLDKHEKTLLKKKVRRAERHVNNLGISCKIYTRAEISKSYLRQIKKISLEYFQIKGRGQRGFSMTLGRIPEILDQDCEFVLAVKNEKILGFLTFVPCYTSSAFSLDTMRRSKSAPNGLIEFLLLQAFEHYKKREVKSLSLNFAAFHQKAERVNTSIIFFLKSFLFKALSYIYKTNQLYNFNKKFLPEWNSRYIAFEHRRHLPLYVYAIAKAELQTD